MRSLFLLMASLLFVVSCKTNKIDNSISYLLPRDVEQKLFDIISKKPNTNYFFYLTQKDKLTYEIFIVDDKSNDNFKVIDRFGYISKSNRKVLINSKFYPLTFTSDYIFGTDMNKTALKTLVERNKIDTETEGYQVFRTFVAFEGVSIVFDDKGEIYN